MEIYLNRLVTSTEAAIVWIWRSLKMKKKRKLLLRIIILITTIPLGLVALLIAVPPTFAAINGDFGFSPVYDFESPNKTKAIVISKKLAFPYYDFVDPAIVVKIRYIETDGKLIDERIEKFIEDSDLKEPSIEWNESGVLIRNLDSRKNYTIEFKNRENKSVVTTPEAAPPTS